METINNYDQTKLRVVAKNKVRRLKRFYTHLVIYGIGMAVYLIGVNFAPMHLFPIRINWFVMSVWTTIIVFHAIRFFVATVVVGKDWEERHIKKVMDKYQQKKY